MLQISKKLCKNENTEAVDTESDKKIIYRLGSIINKLSMIDSTVQICNSKMYLPNYPRDLIQKFIVDNSNYWEAWHFKILDKYIREDSTIVDIGANIGSYVLYWLIEKNVKKVYAFEPLTSTYEILMKNIEINNLQDKVVAYNLGISDEESNARVSFFELNNIGGTHFEKSDKGKFKLITLDSLDIKDKIDFLKIDTEGTELDVLIGATKTIKKYKPVIFIETPESNIKIIDTAFNELGYKLDVKLSQYEFLYIYK